MPDDGIPDASSFCLRIVEGVMFKLMCGKDLAKLGIRSDEGVNISAFLDHLQDCPQCNSAEGSLMDALNKAIGGEKEY